eukprot:6310779-Prymnesium_polylepis.1
MQNHFTKANAVNTAQVHEMHKEARKSANQKGKHIAEKEIADVVAGASVVTQSGEVVQEKAVRDQELVLYEFINVLVRISFVRANPTFGNFGDKKPVVHLPDCTQAMLEGEVLPRARRDTSEQFRETVMEEPSVRAVLEKHAPEVRTVP